MTTISAHPNSEDIMAWSDQELDAPAAAAVRDHVNACASCRALAADLRAVRARADRWQIEPAPATVRAAVLDAVEKHHYAPQDQPGERRVGSWRRYRWQIIAASAIVATMFIGSQISLCGEVICAIPQRVPQAANPPATVSTATQPPATWSMGPRVDLGIPNDGAAVVVVWVVDYECGACAAHDSEFTTLTEHFASTNPPQVKFVVEDWPWNSECNPGVAVTLRGHEASCTAAVAMHLAETRGTGAAMKAWLYGHGLASSAEVREAAASIGRITDFDEQYPSQLAALRARLTVLQQAGVHSTPTCFVNGMLMNLNGGAVSMPVVGSAIESELRRAGKK